MGQWINLFLEQRIHIVDNTYILCEKNCTRTRSGTGSYGRWQSGKIEVNLEIFKNTAHQKIRLFASFNQGTTSLQQ